MQVQLYVYDLSQGLARQYSLALLGAHVDAVYHTSVVFDGVEVFFGNGIQSCTAGTSHHGTPMHILDMGVTHVPVDVIWDYLEGMRSVYTPESYNLLSNNCNVFSNEFCQFLVDRNIPAEISTLPDTFLASPLGQLLIPSMTTLASQHSEPNTSQSP